MNALTESRLRSRAAGLGGPFETADAGIVLEELKRLRAIVAKLPKTADGVTVVPHMHLYERLRNGVVVESIVNMMACSGFSDDDPISSRNHYSTRAEAEAARKERGT